jgi:hypothetical protein
VPPPAVPIGNLGDWNTVEADLGTVLPVDYKQFISLYGTGTISGMIQVGDPFIQPVTAKRYWENWVDFYRCIQDFETKIPYKLFPDRPGLLPCATYADMNIINWLVAGNIGQWKLILYHSSGTCYDLGFISLVDFLCELITNTTALPPRVVSRDIFACRRIEFIPAYV